MLVSTQSAGVVAVHFAAAVEGLTVVSVSADPGLSRGVVLEAAHEVLAPIRQRQAPPQACSLFDLPLGRSAAEAGFNQSRSARALNATPADAPAPRSC